MITNILLITILALFLGLITIGVIIMRNIGKIVQDLTDAATRLEDTSKTKVFPLLDNVVSDSAVQGLADALAVVQRVETSQAVAADRVAQGLPAVPVEGEA